MKVSRFAITDTDYILLQELWRWKILTTSMIHQTIYSPRTPTACYQRLVDLENKKYIESFCSRSGNRWFWQLTEKGFKILDFDDQPIYQVGFRSEHKDHDFLVTLFHLHLWHDFKKENHAIYTEQELRRTDREHYPLWVPHTYQHRPDGYYKLDVNTGTDKSLVAIEVELNLKPVQNYIDLGEFYSDYMGINQVLWLVKSEADAKFILKNLSKNSSRKAHEHSFIILSQWIKDLWQTKIHIGRDYGKTLENIFETSAIPARFHGQQKDFFKFQKKLTNSNTQKPQIDFLSTRSKIIGY